MRHVDRKTSLADLKGNSIRKIADLPGCRLETLPSGQVYIRGTTGTLVRLDAKPLSKKAKKNLHKRG